MNEVQIREKILAFMNREAYKPLSAEDLAEAMRLSGPVLNDFWRILGELEGETAIIKTRVGKYGVPERLNLVVGRLELSRKGFGFVLDDIPGRPDIYVSSSHLAGAMHHDKVVVRLQGQALTGKRQEGEIIRIVERAVQHVVGRFEGGPNYGFVTPDDPALGQDVFIPREGFNGAETGHKVVVEITKWPEKKRSAEGRIREILGICGEPGVDILAIIKSHHLSIDFPPKVSAEARNIPERITPSELEGRRDLRDIRIMTIDGDDSKDLDDAVTLVRQTNGDYTLGVHIADVSYYVREKSALDQEALARGTSVYLVDRVLPMLPERLSNGICSLNAGVDRLALSIDMTISPKGIVRDYEIYPSVIRVGQRFTYGIVRRILVDEDPELRQQYEEWLPMLEEMADLCHILKRRRFRRGAIDFDFPEYKVKLDGEGKPVEIVRRERTLSESIIEEFMLVANETVAEHMEKQKLPFVYRIHEQPDREKMAKLNELLSMFDLKLPLVEDVKPGLLQRVLEKISGKPEEKIISTVMLRSLKQARYEAENHGHFGLAAPYYTHFTSPIRRYPDLMVHRLLHEAIAKKLTIDRQDHYRRILPEITAQASLREREAADAERETVQLKSMEYMAQFEGQEFEGIISGVTSFGLFVELGNGTEGLIHVSTMDDDYYHFLEDRYILLGERTGIMYQLGDTVQVRLVQVNLQERSMDFVLASRGLPAERQLRKKLIQQVKNQEKEGPHGLQSHKSERTRKTSKSLKGPVKSPKPGKSKVKKRTAAKKRGL